MHIFYKKKVLCMDLHLFHELLLLENYFCLFYLTIEVQVFLKVCTANFPHFALQVVELNFKCQTMKFYGLSPKNVLILGCSRRVSTS